MSRERGEGVRKFVERNVDSTDHEDHHGDVGEIMILNGRSNKFICNKTN